MQRKQDTSSKPQLKIAEQVKALKITGEGALWDLESDMGQFEWLRTLMWVIKREAEDGKAGSTDRIKQLLTLATTWPRTAPTSSTASASASRAAWMLSGVRNEN